MERETNLKMKRGKTFFISSSVILVRSFSGVCKGGAVEYMSAVPHHFCENSTLIALLYVFTECRVDLLVHRH